ncbi:MAG: NAD(P)-binding domain-containing protein [Planctomycetota bacterium]
MSSVLPPNAAGSLLLVLTFGLVGATLVLLRQRAAARQLSAQRAERWRAQSLGTDRAQLQYPEIDASRCIGCGTCVSACPEHGVLDVVHGQAVVVHGARCVGHGICAEECPTEAIRVTLGDLSEREDIPILEENLQASGQPGLFVAGEISGFALIRTAVLQGTQVARAAAEHLATAAPEPRQGLHDLLIVGAGPAGLACSLEAKRLGLDFATLEQAELGGAVASYPRRKLVMTQPMELPLHGRLKQLSFQKEELIELWSELAAEHDLPIRTGVRLEGVARLEDGSFSVETSAGRFHARSVCLAVGRRGTPNKLGVPGEDQTKVAYALLDTRSYQGRDILVVGGGDSAVEAAIGLAEAGNRVSLSYRKPEFFRIKARNAARLERAVENTDLRVLTSTQVATIESDRVHLQDLENRMGGDLELPNHDVFVMAGGKPPFGLLQAAGVSFDASLRTAEPEEEATPKSGLLGSLLLGLALTLGAVAWTAIYGSYYGLAPADRVEHADHPWLQPSGTFGLGIGIAATVLVALNLAYLLRRSQRLGLRWGSLKSWMTLHVFTGIAALVLALLHSSLAPGDTVGGHALAALGVLVLTGAIGRYFYAFVPRAANGKELALDEVRHSLVALEAELDRERGEFAGEVRREVDAQLSEAHWGRGFGQRLIGLLAARRRQARSRARLIELARAEGLADDQIQRIASLITQAHRRSLAAAHLEDLRGILSTWRWLHRWVGLFLVLLIGLHIYSSLRFGGLID